MNRLATHPRLRRGTILIVTMIASFTIAAMVLVLSRSMRVEVIAAANSAAAVQASAVERGAEQYLLGLITDQGPEFANLTEDYFAAVPVGEGYFWVLHPNYDDPDQPLFGVVGESAKVNINEATSADQLMRLPGITPDIADSIIAWKNAGSITGADSGYYSSLPEPYQPKQDRFETVEELLLIRDFTPELLYGTGGLQPLGTPVSSINTTSTLVTDRQLARGLYDLLTVYSDSRNAPDGRERRRLERGSDVRSVLQQQLGGRASQIIAALGNRDPRSFSDFRTRGRLSVDELGKVALYLTEAENSSQVRRNARRRIDVVNASHDVLMAGLNLESTDADKLISARSGADTTDLTWAIQALGAERATPILDRMTTVSSEYSADILAVSGDGRAFKRVRIVIETRGTTPYILYRRDITERDGWPMDEQVLASLRAGQGPGQTLSTGTSSSGRSTP